MSTLFDAWMGSSDRVETPRALVVDDESFMRDLIQRWLCDAGFHCDKASNADQAQSLIETGDIELVVSDVRMPGRSGVELLQWVNRARPTTAFIMLTAVGDLQTAIASLTHGASGYLTKPAEREELLIQVRNAVERRRLRLENQMHLERLEAKVLEQTQEIRHAHEETIHCLLNASRFRDEETGAHIRRTGLLSEALAIGIGWNESRSACLRLAAPMHDIGKIGIPDAILRKPGKLTEEEYAVMKTHTIIGARMLAGSRTPMLKMAYGIALNHHEHWNGRGYPHGLAGERIPEEARIVSIVDVYDALSHDRVYRPAMTEDRVIEILKEGRGRHFESRLTDAFLDLLPEMRRIIMENPDEPVEDYSLDTCWQLADVEWTNHADCQTLAAV